jgi:hypothetical protein
LSEFWSIGFGREKFQTPSNSRKCQYDMPCNASLAILF